MTIPDLRAVPDPPPALPAPAGHEPSLRPLRALHRLFWAPAAAINLAVLRIAVFGALGVTALTSHVVAFSRLPDELIAAPPQLGGLLVALPRQPPFVAAALWLMVAACAAALIGWRVKTTGLLAAVLALYILGIPQLYGKVDHYHHLVWLALLLACSPCADRLAVDSRRRPTPAASARYGFPLRVAWLLIGCCYLFPGLAKLGEWRTWLSPGNLRGLLDLQQWAAHGGLAVPGWALFPLAAATLVFELTFVFAVFNRRLRPWFVVAGLAFHFGTFATMGILFWSLWVCYVAFVDWSRWFGRPTATDREPPWPSTKAVSGVLVVGVVVTGLTFFTSAWPFASYPTFVGQFAGTDHASTMEIVGVVHGRARPVSVLDWLPGSRRFAVVNNALHHPDVLARFGRRAAPDADAIQVWRVVESTSPRTRGRELSRTLLLEVTLR